MKFVETSLSGAYLIELERIEDQRGFFARSFCAREFEARGIVSAQVQCNISFNHKAGTVRGMHFQVAPHEEAKLVRCTMGAIHDVIVDLRPASATYRQWFGADLSAGNRRMLFVPAGFAHGFQTLEDNSEVFYQMSEFHRPEHARGVRFDDPALGIRWPRVVTSVSDRDRAYPLLSP